MLGVDCATRAQRLECADTVFSTLAHAAPASLRCTNSACVAKTGYLHKYNGVVSPDRSREAVPREVTNANHARVDGSVYLYDTDHPLHDGARGPIGGREAAAHDEKDVSTDPCKDRNAR